MNAQEHAMSVVRHHVEDALLKVAMSQDPDLTEDDAQTWVSHLLAEGLALEVLHVIAQTTHDIYQVAKLR